VRHRVGILAFTIESRRRDPGLVPRRGCGVVRDWLLRPRRFRPGTTRGQLSKSDMDDNRRPVFFREPLREVAVAILLWVGLLGAVAILLGAVVLLLLVIRCMG
jgi:hypothetical protein